MADLKSDITTALKSTSMADVANSGARALRSVESGLGNALNKGKKFVSDHTPESLKDIYRDARGYRVRPRTQARSQTRK